MRRPWYAEAGIVAQYCGEPLAPTAAAFSILLWLAQYLGWFALPTVFGALDWHVHEMLYGYGAATIAGFLLTAIPNWTGSLPVVRHQRL